MAATKISQILADSNPYNKEWKLKGSLKPHSQAGEGWWHLFEDSSGSIYLYFKQQVSGKRLVKGQLAYQQTGPYFYATDVKTPSTGPPSALIFGLGGIGILICAFLLLNEILPYGLSLGYVMSMFQTSSSLSPEEKMNKLNFILEGTYRDGDKICADITNNADIAVAKNDLVGTKMNIDGLPVDVETALLPGSVGKYESFVICACSARETNGCSPMATTYQYKPDSSGKYPPISIQINLPYGILSLRG